MKKIPGHFSHLALWVLLMALLAACGKNTTLTSSTTPLIFDDHSVAFRNHTTFSWGANTYGQLGNGDSTGASQSLPMKILIKPIVDGIAVGGTHTLAFKNNSSVYAWGNNGDGQLGNNTQTASSLPVLVRKRYPGSSPAEYGILTNVIAVAAGGSHSLALDSANSVWSWGDNTFGQLGDNTNTIRLAAVQLQVQLAGSPLAQVTKLAAGGYHSLALMTGGTVMSWGYNRFGQLGQQSNLAFHNFSTSTNSLYPVPITSLTTVVTDIAAGGSHSLFLDSVHNVWACGYNAFGQLGVGDTTDRNHGVVPVDLSAVSASGTGNPIQVAAGLDHSLLLTDSGYVWAWGSNSLDQLGNGPPNPTLSKNTLATTPVQVLQGPSPGKPLINVIEIAAIGNHSLAVVYDGTTYSLWAWGDNTFGQLGDGTHTSSPFAIQIQVDKFTTTSPIYLYQFGMSPGKGG